MGEVYTSYSIRRIDFDPELSKKAEEHIGRALALSPELAEARRALGRFYIGQRRFDRAAEELAAAIELKPNYADAYYSLGASRFEEGKYAEALKAFQKVLELRPTFFLAFLTAAETAWVLRDYPLSEGYLKRCDEIFTGHFKSFDIWGWIYLRRGKLDLALDAFRKASERCENASLAESIAFGLILLNDLDTVVRFLKKTGNSVNGTNLYFLGLAYQLAGMEGEARLTWETDEAFIEKQLSTVPAVLTPLMLVNLALVRGALGKPDAALALIRRGEEVQQAKPEERATLKVAEAILLAVEGKAPEAVRGLKEANSKYYTAAEAALDPRLRKISASNEFKEYFNLEKRRSAG